MNNSTAAIIIIKSIKLYNLNLSAVLAERFMLLNEIRFENLLNKRLKHISAVSAFLTKIRLGR